MYPRSLVCLAALLAAGTSVVQAADRPMKEVVDGSLDFAAVQYGQMLESLEGKTGYPRTLADGQVALNGSGAWTSGFFPGSLWLLFEATGDAKWREAAESFTAGIEKEKDNRRTHDVGFMLYCSFGNGLRLTGDAHYREVLLAGAESLATRFNPVIGCTQSWNGRKWRFPVIIDNMMNLELLLWAANAGNDPRFREMAVRHADTTMKNHFRPDGSSFHVVDYDPETGAVLARQTSQGFSDPSAWARGQTWGLYGYAMMYRETRQSAYLEQARKIAAFLVAHPRLPADKVPYWDFDAPGIPDEPRDASSAAIMCAALFELAGFVDGDDRRAYVEFAEAQLRSLASPAYRAEVGTNGCFLLMHSTGARPKNSEVDVPLVYADYYFLEALLRCRERLRPDVAQAVPH